MNVKPTMTTAKVGASPMNSDTRYPMSAATAIPASKAQPKGTCRVPTRYPAR